MKKLFVKVPYWYAEFLGNRTLETRFVLAYIEGLDDRGLPLYRSSFERMSEVLGIPIKDVAYSILSLRGFVPMNIGTNERVTDTTGVFVWNSGYPKSEPTTINGEPRYIGSRPGNIYLFRLDSAYELIEDRFKVVRGERKYGYVLNQTFLALRGAANSQKKQG